MQVYEIQGLSTKRKNSKEIKTKAVRKHFKSEFPNIAKITEVAESALCPYQGFMICFIRD